MDLMDIKEIEYIQSILLRSRRGDLMSVDILAYKYFFGNGIKINKKLSKELIYHAYNKNKKDKFAEGMLHFFANDYKAAYESFCKHYQQDKDLCLENTSYAVNFIGYILNSGKGGIKADTEKAIKFYNKAISKGNDSALLNMAYLYLRGCGVEKDVQKAKMLFKQSVKKGNSDSMVFLANIYLAKNKIDKVLHYLNSSIEFENDQAMFNLAYIYFNGEFIEKDLNKSIEYFKRGSDRGNKYCSNFLGHLYSRGEQVASNYELAAAYFHKSVDEENDSLKGLKSLIHSNKVGWQTSYHKYFSRPVLDRKISLLLNISKHRNRYPKAKFLVKGLAMIIIGYLCQNTQ